MADAVIQLRDLQQRHAELQAVVRAQDAELQQLRDVADAATALQSQDIQTAKIIELSKKNRQLQLQLEKERTQASKIRAEMSKKTQPVLPPEAVEGIARQVVEQAAEAADQAQRQADMWRDKCQQNTNKISQLEQKVFTLEIEAKKLTRALVREVGDDVPLAKVLDEGSSDWKGRREQIIALRNQVQALKTAQGLAPESRHEVAAKKVLSKVAGGKAAELEQLRAELSAARQEAETQRARAEGALSRRKILETELASLKEKVSVVLNKTQNDDRLIAALKTELAALRRTGAAQSEPSRPPVEQDDELWRELSALRRRCGEQRQQIERYESTIQTLNDRLALAVSPSAHAPHPSDAGQALSPSSSLQRRLSARVSSGSMQQGGAAGTPRSLGHATQHVTATQDPAGPSPHASDSVGLPQPSGQPHARGAQQGAAAAAGTGILARQPSLQRAQTPVEVRGEALDQQLKLAQVEIARLQELVTLLTDRIQELEDELADRQEAE